MVQALPVQISNWDLVLAGRGASQSSNPLTRERQSGWIMARTTGAQDSPEFELGADKTAVDSIPANRGGSACPSASWGLK